MASPLQPRGEAETICSCCGGSGMLRLGDQRYRTCMECVGQGRLPALAPATTVVAVLQGEGMQGEGLQGEGSPTEVPQLQRQRAADVIALEDRRRFNGSVSSSAAR